MIHAAAFIAVGVLAAVLGSCVEEVPRNVVMPSATGVVASFDRQAEGIEVRLEDGTTVFIPNGARSVGGSVEEGKLLIYGDQPLPRRSDGPWYVSMSGFPSGCFRLPGNGEIRDGRMALSFGFSQPLSEDWQETETRFVDEPAGGVCLDDSGAVTRPY